MIPGMHCLVGAIAVEGHSMPAGQSAQVRLLATLYWPGLQGTGYACRKHRTCEHYFFHMFNC